MTVDNPIQLRLPKALQDEIRRLAAQQNIPVNRYITELLSQRLREEVEVMTLEQKVDLILEYLQLKKR